MPVLLLIGFGFVLSVALAYALAALVGAVVAYVRSSRKERLIRSVVSEHDLTPDEEEVFAMRVRHGPPVTDSISWRSARLRRLAGEMCTGLPGVVHAKLLRVIEADPARAARIVDDEDSFRKWALADGLSP